MREQHTISQYGEDGMLPKKYDTGLSIFFIAFGTVILILSFTVRTRTVLTIGPGFMPRIVGVIILILGAILFINSHVRGASKDKESPVGEDCRGPFSWSDNSKFILLSTILLLIIYVGLLEILGFPLMTSVYLALQFYLLTEKKTLKMFILFTGAAILGSAAITLIFTQLLGLYLPLGVFS
jgi:putative tricarboxylic transport membrane protein